MTKSRVMESSFGQMVDHIKETGIMVNNMEKVSMLLHRELRSMENGRKARE